jgi:murein DD-endopeptidase MepM/ murein hydrolase activator NlpD
MRDENPQKLRKLFTIICFLLLSSLQIIYATEPQNEIRIQSETAYMYDVFVPIDRNDDPTIKSIISSLPSYLREGFITDDTTFRNDEEKGAVICENPGIPTELHFRWDTHTIMEKRFCEEVVGEKQTSQPWAGRYMFQRTDSFPWTRSIRINDLHVDEGALSDTYADLTTKSGYAVLWSFGSSVGSNVEFGGNTENKPFLGTLESINGNLMTLYIIDRNKHAVNISEAKLSTCSVSDITTQSFDQSIEVEYYGEGATERIDAVDFSSLRFAYDKVESTFTPTETPTPTLTPTPTFTLTPIPTVNIVIVNSATATPTPSQNSKLETLNPNTTVTETTMFTTTPTQNSKSETLNSKEDEPDNAGDDEDSGKQGGGEVLGAQSEKPPTEPTNPITAMLCWMGAMLGAVSSLIVIKKRKVAKHTISVLLFLGIWSLVSSNTYAVSPQLLVKITDPRTYYARSTTGSIDLITYPPNFYFTGAVPGGRVVLSSTPDGTGNVSLGNGGFLTRTLTYWSSTANFGMNPPTNKGDCYAAQNLPPRELPIQYFTSQNTTYNVRATFQGYCQGPLWNVSTLYLVYFPPEPTATPTNTPTPTPTTVPPFLDLPWDYASDDLTFTEAALRMTSYFDHEYPFISTSMFSPDYIVRYKGDKIDRPYSSHDGYDYARISKVTYGDDQLAAAGGIASYHYDKFSGHAIFIDHGNGYQTRYYHMQPNGLIINTQGQTKSVSAGQKIGKVGYSGNVSPAGLDGAHIHFMVIYDKNHDGNFQDNIPDGIVDPFGWQGEGADPWETFQFDYAGKTRTGMKSTYLWKTSTASQSEQVGSSGGEVKNEKVKITIPPLVLPDLLQFFIRSAPRTTIDTHTESVGSIADITAVDGGGIAVKSFSQPINISFTYSADDALYYDPDHMNIYSSPDGALWEKEQTLINHDTRTATATVDHLTFFALMGERRDVTAPQTTLALAGQGKGMNFHSDVTIELDARDPCSIENSNACHPEPVEGSTIDYTLFKLDDGEWGAYTEPVTVPTEGAHTLQYFSADKSGNVENTQTVEFSIDQTIPEIAMQYDTVTQEFIYTTDSDATVHEPSEGIVIAEDTAGNVHELRYQKTITDDLTTIEFIGEYSGLYAVSNEYEYFQSGDMVIRKIPTGDGRLSIDVNDEITEDTTTTSLHIITNHGKLEIHD